MVQAQQLRRLPSELRGRVRRRGQGGQGKTSVRPFSRGGGTRTKKRVLRATSGSDSTARGSGVWRRVGGGRGTNRFLRPRFAGRERCQAGLESAGAERTVARVKTYYASIRAAVRGWHGSPASSSTHELRVGITAHRVFGRAIAPS